MRKEKLTLYCDQDQAADIKRRAAGQGLSMSAYIFKLVSNELSPTSDPAIARLSLLVTQSNAIIASLQELVVRLPEHERAKVKQNIKRRRENLNEKAQERLL